jgi:hypothetical protein
VIRLLELRDGRARIVLPAGRDVAAWHAALTSEIAAHLTPEHAFLLASPVNDAGNLSWFAEGTAMRRFGELDRDDRDRLTSATTAILSDIRRLAESGKAAAVAAAWPALRTIPDLTHLFAVDGRPVLAGWGFSSPAGGSGPLAAFDDGIAWPAPPKLPWQVYGGTLAGLAALALVCGLLLVPVGGWLLPSPAVCRAAPGQLELMSEQSREAARTDTLRAQLAQLREGRGGQALQCPIPHAAVVPPPPVPRPPRPVEPVPAPTPPPKQADLPENRWNRHDVGILKGCWNNSTRFTMNEERTGRVNQVKKWTFCFDDKGHGRQRIELDDGEHCENDMSATFGSDNSLRLLESDECRFQRGPLRPGRMICERQSDLDALCRRRPLTGPQRNVDITGGFSRADAGTPDLTRK